MGNWHELDKVIEGDDLDLYNISPVDSQQYNYDTVFTIDESIQKFVQPNISELCGLLRKTCLEIELARKTTVIGYFANSSQIVPGRKDINFEDVKYMADILRNINYEVKTADFILSSPGGLIESSKKLTDLIRHRFEQLSFLLPGATFSGAVAMTFAGDEIIMSSVANMGPINQRVNDIDTYLGKQYFKTYKRYRMFAPWVIKHLNEAKIAENNVTMRTLKNIEKTVYLVAFERLSKYLFKAHQEGWLEHLKMIIKIRSIVKFFTDFKRHLSVPFCYEELRSIGLPVKKAAPVLDKQLSAINNICDELTSTIWYEGNRSYYIRKVYFSSKNWYILKHYLPLNPSQI